MRLSQVRVEAGHYLVNGYTILNGGKCFWQVREMDEIIEHETSLRNAIRLAQSFTTGQDVRENES